MRALSNTIMELVSQVDYCDITRQDVDMTLSLAMTEGQRWDLMAMIQFLQNSDMESQEILFNVLHDLQGLKAIYLNDPLGNCFSPRSHGYAKTAIAN